MIKERATCHDSYCYCWIRPFIHWRWHDGRQGKNWWSRCQAEKRQSHTRLWLFQLSAVNFPLQSDTFDLYHCRLPLSLCVCVYALLYISIQTWSSIIALSSSPNSSVKPKSFETIRRKVKYGWKPRWPNDTTETHAHSYIYTHTNRSAHTQTHKAAEKLTNASTYQGRYREKESYLEGRE